MKSILEHAQIGDRMIKNPVSWLLSKLNVVIAHSRVVSLENSVFRNFFGAFI
jgi:hypothetical protein